VDLLARPVLQRLLPYSALDDLAYDLSHFVQANEWLDVDAENSARVRKALEGMNDGKRGRN
jgi:hypothetical protein